jgi:4-hydroxythreonine-4-phosphate dehydrogenase
MNGRLPCIILTTGEPAGIGPDISLQMAQEPIAARLVAVGDPTVLRDRLRLLGLNVAIELRTTVDEVREHTPGKLQVLPVASAWPVKAQQLDPRNADYVLETIRQAAMYCLRQEAQAMVTAPVQKSVINEAGISFSGHTEFLAELTGAARPVMMLASPRMRVALATTHLPLREVADAVTADGLESLLRIIHTELRSKLGLTEPRILVLGLNPHAGESGVLGNEEITTIRPVVQRLAEQGINVRGPVPADTAFTTESLTDVDIVVAMYHDQGLPVIKASGFGEIVNVTLGLPIIRTSVDHGTALDLAGTGRAHHDSLVAATQLALKLASRAANPSSV